MSIQPLSHEPSAPSSLQPQPSALPIAMAAAAFAAAHEAPGLMQMIPEMLTLYKAAKDGRVDVIRVILATRTCSPRIISEALLIAIQKGHVETVRLMATHPTLTQNALRSALSLAVEKNHREIACSILPLVQGQFPHIEDFIIRVAEKGWADILSALLQRGSISSRVRDSAITLAPHGAIRDILVRARVFTTRMSARAAAGSGGEGDRLILRLHELRSDPDLWLFNVSKTGVPAEVCFLEYPEAVDLSGITKQFISTLFHGLIQEKVFFRTETGLLSAEREEQLVRLRQLGRFYSLLDLRNSSRSDRFLTGIFCHPRFFEFSAIAASGMSKPERLIQAARLLAAIDPDQAIVAQIISHPTEASCQEFQAIKMCPPGDEELEAAAIVQGYLRAAYAIYEGASRALRTKICAHPTEILRTLQGDEASIESIIDALHGEGGDEALYIKIDWIKEKIRTSDVEFRKKFLLAVTGKTTLYPGERLRIRQTWREGGYFEFHTCFNSIDLPRQELTREEFLQALESSLDETYNTA